MTSARAWTSAWALLTTTDCPCWMLRSAASAGWSWRDLAAVQEVGVDVAAGGGETVGVEVAAGQQGEAFALGSGAVDGEHAERPGAVGGLSGLRQGVGGENAVTGVGRGDHGACFVVVLGHRGGGDDGWLGVVVRGGDRGGRRRAGRRRAR